MAKELTVAVTGANSLIGQALVPVLIDNGYKVIALTRKEFTSQAQVHVFDWTNNSKAISALRQADSAVHLSGEIYGRSWETFYDANVRTTEIVTNAISNRQQIIFLSYPGANPDSTNLFLQAKGKAEELIQAASDKPVIFRVQAIFHTPQKPGPFESYLTYNGKEPIRIIGDGQQPLHLVYYEDVVRGIVEAIQQVYSGVYDFFGQVMTLNELAYVVNKKRRIKISYLPVWMAKLFSRFSSELSPVTVDLYARPPVLMNNANSLSTFSFPFTQIASIWSHLKREH